MTPSTRSGVTAPSGFLAGGMSCGLKEEGVLDLAIIASDRPAVASGLFTNNLVIGAPVKLSKKHLRFSGARGIVINSGNANVLSKDGALHAEMMAKTLSRFLGCQPEQTFVASTGVIGKPLEIDKVVKGIRNLAPTISQTGAANAALAILTTDLVTKESEATLKIGSKDVTVGGCAKGSGMIHPSMGTMLGFITTDAAVTKPVLCKILQKACDESFHKITVDGDTSTSDMVIILANGASGAPVIDKTSGKRFLTLQSKVTEVCVDLAKKIVRDGEGATKFVTVIVKGARSDKDANLAARAIAGSNLVKTALFGRDANWGRIMAAAGYSGAKFDPAKSALSICGVPILKKGQLVPDDWEKEVTPKLELTDVSIELDLFAGKAQAVVWTCDLSHDYIRINAAYRS